MATVLKLTGTAGSPVVTPPMDELEEKSNPNQTFPCDLDNFEHQQELLDGLPTIVGGYDNTKQNDVLYQVLEQRKAKFVVLNQIVIVW